MNAAAGAASVSVREGTGTPGAHHGSLAVWAALVVLYLVLRSWRLTAYGLWADEVFSVRTAQLAWPHLFGVVAADAVHPPLFYVLLKLWMGATGTTLLSLKLLPLVLSVGALAPVWLLGRDRVLTPGETALALWLVAVNGYLIYYSQELRMYSLLFCLSGWSLWLFLRLMRAAHVSWRVVLALSVVNLLLVYSHYFGWLLVGAQGLCVLVWRTRVVGGFALSVAALVAGFAPWVYAVVASKSGTVSAVEGLQWIQRPGWPEVLWYLATLNGILPWRHTVPWGLLLFGAPIVIALLPFRRNRQPWRQSPRMLGVLAFVPMALAFIASRVLPQSVWGERYLMVVALPYLLLVAVSVSYVPRVAWQIVLAVLIVTWTGVAGWSGMSRQEGRIPWKSLVQHMIDQEGTAQGRVRVYAFEGWTAAPIEFRFAELGNRHFDVLPGEPDPLPGEHFWVAFRDPSLRVHAQPRAVLERRECRVDAERSATDGGQQVVVFRATC